jgi:integrase
MYDWLSGLRLVDVRVGIARPHLQVRAESAKLNRPRRVPLWWDAATHGDLAAWKALRQSQGAKAFDPFICSLQRATFVRPINRHMLRRRFLTACGVLGNDRLWSLTIHHGRHTFISHALAGGRTLAQVRAAAGHANLLTTSATCTSRWTTKVPRARFSISVLAVPLAGGRPQGQRGVRPRRQP